jgi:hypothetical protein
MYLFKNVLFIISLIGIIFIIIDIVRTYYKCPPNQVIYRYMPRTFKEEQTNPVPLSDIFKVLFNEPSPWINSIDTYTSNNSINDRFISQG